MWNDMKKIIKRIGIYTGRRDHIVPKQMIKRFADNKGELWELIKPEFKFSTRPRRPKGILFREDYYKDEIGDIDKELLKPIENRFQKYYPKLADGPWSGKTWPTEVGSAFIDWVAALMCRTNMLVAMTRNAMDDQEPILKLMSKLVPKAMDNLFRSQWFCEHQDFLTRSSFRWKCLDITKEKNTVITDNPVILSGNLGHGNVVIVPLSKRRIILGGFSESLAPWASVSVEYINLLLGAWAEKHIFAADRDTLQILARNLRGEGEFESGAFLEAALKPLFGLPDRILNAYRSDKGTIDISKAWESLKDSYGVSIIKRELDTNS
jgi:hypothetical protein